MDLIGQKLRIYRMITGEEVVANEVSSNEKEVEVTIPLQLMLSPVQGGGHGLKMGPWAMFHDCKGTIKLKQLHILYTHEADKKISDSYVKMVEQVKQQKSEILTPSASDKSLLNL